VRRVTVDGKSSAKLGEDNDPTDWEEPDDWLNPPSDVELRDRTLQRYPPPGTPGHVVFVDPVVERDVRRRPCLPHITPSIGAGERCRTFTAAGLLRSLRLVRACPTGSAAGDGPVSPSVHHAVDQLLEHHTERLET